MNRPKVNAKKSIGYLIASPRVVSARQAAAVQPHALNPPAHDAFRRFLDRANPDPNTLWVEARTQVRRTDGVPKCLSLPVETHDF